MLHKLHLIRYDLQFVQSWTQLPRTSSWWWMYRSLWRQVTSVCLALRVTFFPFCERSVPVFRCYEPVRPLPGFDPRTFVTLNDFFRNLSFISPAVHVSRPAVHASRPSVHVSRPPCCACQSPCCTCQSSAAHVSRPAVHVSRPAVHVICPARFVEIWLIRMKVNEWMNEVRWVRRNNRSLPVGYIKKRREWRLPDSEGEGTTFKD